MKCYNDVKLMIMKMTMFIFRISKKTFQFCYYNNTEMKWMLEKLFHISEDL